MAAAPPFPAAAARETRPVLPLALLRACLALNAVQRVLSAAVLAPLVTYFLWQSPAFATATVCSCLQSLCSYEFAWLAHRIQHRLLRALHAQDEALATRTSHADEAAARDPTATASTSRDASDDRYDHLLTHGSDDDDALAMLQASARSLEYSSLSGSAVLTADATPAAHSERPLLETPPETPEAETLVRPTRLVNEEDDNAKDDGIDPTQYAVSRLADRVTLRALRRHRLLREWLVSLAVSLAVGAVSTVLFLLAVEAWLPQLEEAEIYSYRVFYGAATHGIGMLCACFAPDWRYAAIVFLENVVFTVLTMYSSVCPINQFTCTIVLEPLQVLLVSLGLVLLLRLATSSSSASAFVLFVLDALGFLYIVGTLSVLVAFVDDDKRTLYRKLLIVLLYVTWASDTGAYVTGKLLAYVRYPYYHPLAAHLSKNKDYEGTLGAVVWGLAAMFLASHLLSVGGSVWTKTAFTVVGVVIGRFGDLFESLLKRAAGVKDSGALIPGHGGVLDRIDALMFITLVFARYYALVLRHE